MLLKRIADTSGPEPADGEGWPVSHIEVRRAGPLQNFTPRLLFKGIDEGWVSIDGDTIKLKTKPKLTYHVLRKPGHYCAHCDAALAGETEARAHVAEQHDGEISPDPGNPAGYRVDNFFACELVGDPIGKAGA